MNRVQAVIGCLMASSILTPVSAWGEILSSGDSMEDPKPYVYKDSGLGTGARFTLNRSGVLPGWLSLAVQHRSRYETLDRAFRSGASGSDQVYALRTLAQATVHLPQRFKVQLEFQDSRAYLNDAGSVVNNTIVNTAELLEANLQWTADGLFQEGSRLLLRAGRLTMDFGKRRLVARNRYRNTKNNFTGFDAIWQAQGGQTVRVMATMPVNRLPTAQQQLLDNEAEFDEESPDRILWGVFLSTPNLPWGSQGELYLFGLHEEDGDFDTRNRRLYTPGLRLYRPAQTGRFDYEWETIFQFGTSRISAAPSDTRDLDHFAHFHHVEAGYSFPVMGSPRLVLAYDYASGDSNPNDGKDGRFDSLFGANVFDFGPTTIHRAFVRSNITGLGAKLQLRPHKNFRTTLHYRAFWLASKTDVWAGNSGLRDVTGRSGSFLGQLIYLMGAWQATPNLWFESGVAYRIDGDFQKRVPGSPGQGNSTLAYLAATLSF